MEQIQVESNVKFNNNYNNNNKTVYQSATVWKQNWNALTKIDRRSKLGNEWYHKWYSGVEYRR